MWTPDSPSLALFKKIQPARLKSDLDRWDVFDVDVAIICELSHKHHLEILTEVRFCFNENDETLKDCVRSDMEMHRGRYVVLPCLNVSIVFLEKCPIYAVGLPIPFNENVTIYAT
ncbi:hypothetical protein QR680_003063 [Steinernema hermaphroditum]|uniref:Uncharacterized protein n=1 Tax=Steinernema hermaphroditum TaxID=289476 RepID=A0AA39H664_9BILA|nr:hypothetical protein QR680_003063 [Steinernema hermaphroditum]